MGKRSSVRVPQCSNKNKKAKTDTHDSTSMKLNTNKDMLPKPTDNEDTKKNSKVDKKTAITTSKQK